MHYQSVVFGMSRSFSFSPVWKDHLFAAHHKAMQPNMLEGSTRKYVKLLAETFDARLSELGPGGKQVDLIDYVYDIIVSANLDTSNLVPKRPDTVPQYTASSKALFSRSFPSAATKKPFLAFDQFFPLLTLKELPVLARKPAVAAREQLLDLLVEWWKTTTEEDQKGLAPQIMITWDTKESEGWTDRDFMALLLAELWALEANAPYGKSRLRCSYMSGRLTASDSWLVDRGRDSAQATSDSDAARRDRLGYPAARGAYPRIATSAGSS